MVLRIDRGIWGGGECDSGNMQVMEILCTPSEWYVSFSCAVHAAGLLYTWELHWVLLPLMAIFL